MKLQFKINPYYLLFHSLERSWGNKPFPAWAKLASKIKPNRNFLLNPSGRAFIKITDNKKLHRNFSQAEAIFSRTLKTDQFRKLLRETKVYLSWVRKEWEQKRKQTLGALYNITGLRFPLITIRVLLTHPKLSNGINFPEEKVIGWGHQEDWKNYTVVYLCHEILHILTYKKSSNEKVMHALIELAIDNELRIRLNKKGVYFKEGGYEVGHSGLRNLEKRILPVWKKYLRDAFQAKNILDLERKISRKIQAK